MHDDARQFAPLALLALLLAGAGGCAQSGGWLDRAVPAGSGGAEPVTPGAPSADDYLRELDRLATGDPATQIEIYADAESRSTLTPDPSTNLRFALVLATPGHSGTDLEHAQSMLRELIPQTALMTPAEVALAHVYLNSVEQQLTVEAERDRLRRTAASRNSRTEELVLSRRIAEVEADNRRLRGELDAAQEKLDAITSIEQVIREQDQE